ncbi:MAG: PKD domain-containing protein [Nitrospinae bacterium]|nr:PKD domain-containing protein [Nitrospinota bacterium]
MRSNIFKPCATILAAVLSLALVSCGQGGQDKESSGQPGQSKTLNMSLNFPSGYSYNRDTHELVTGSSPVNALSLAPYITQVALSISGPNIETIVLSVPLDTLTVTVYLPDGEYTFYVVVFTNLGLTFTDSQTGVVGAGLALDLNFNLEVNAPPVIDGISVGTSVTPKRTPVSITVNASDPDGDALSYSFSGGGSVSGSAPNFSWSADHSGNYTITVTVDDGHGAASIASFGITVTNQAPVINSVSADNTEPTTAETVGLSCSASDPDGDSITYTWSDGAGWSASGSSVSYSPTTAGSVTVTCTASDGDGGTDTGSVTLNVTNANNSPAISFVDVFELDALDDWLSHNGVIVNNLGCFDNTFQFECFASDPDGDGITYTWSVSVIYWLNGANSDSTTLSGHYNPFPQGAVLNSNAIVWDVWNNWLGVLDGAFLTQLSVTCTATDGKGGSASKTVTFTGGGC